jgi:hypothetical protein
MVVPILLRGDFDGPMLRALALSEKARQRHAAPSLLWSRFMKAARAGARLGSEGSACRCFAIGCFGSTPRARTVSSMANRPDVRPCSTTNKGSRSAQWLRPVRSRDPRGRALEAD